MKKQAPTIVVLSEDGEDSFRWLSGGWYSAKVSGTMEADRLMERARKCIADGEDVPDVIRRLEKAGFRVERAAG